MLNIDSLGTHVSAEWEFVVAGAALELVHLPHAQHQAGAAHRAKDQHREQQQEQQQRRDQQGNEAKLESFDFLARAQAAAELGSHVIR